MQRFFAHLSDGKILQFKADFYRDNHKNNTVEFIIIKDDIGNPMFPKYFDRVGELSRITLNHITSEETL